MRLIYFWHSNKSAFKSWNRDKIECGEISVEEAEKWAEAGMPVEVHDGHWENPGMIHII